MRTFIFLIIFLMIPIVLAVPECLRETPIQDIPCYIISSFRTAANCNTHTVTIYNYSGHIVYTAPFGDYTPKCNVTLNITTAGTYTYNSTLDDGVITIIQEDNMTSLGIIIFLILLNVALFYIPFRVNFTNDEITNNAIKKIVWVIGFVVLIFVTTILITLADNYALGITQELFVFQWIFLKALYVVIILLFWNIIKTTAKLMTDRKDSKRMGAEDEE